MADRVTRFATDLVEAATYQGARQSRSAKQQLDYWARLGMAVAAQQTVSRRRMDAVLAGTLPMDALRADERAIVNAEIDARVQAAALSTPYGEELAARGVTTVALEPDGTLMAYHPDGSRSPLG